MSKIEVVHDTGYGLVQRRVMRDRNLSIQAKSIYSYLASFAGNTGKSFPSTELMAYELDLSKNTLFKYLRELREKKIITVKKEKTEGNKFGKNIYYLHNKIGEEIKEETPCIKSSYTEIPYTRNEDTNSNNLNSNNLNKENSAFKESTTSKEAIEENFESMWKLYPNKRNKGQVSYSKKKEIYKLGEEFKRCIERYVEDTENRRKNNFPELKYKVGSTFFNSGYVDYLDSNYKDVMEKVEKGEEKKTSSPYSRLPVY